MMSENTIDDARLRLLLGWIENEVDRGSLPSAQVAVAYRGEVVADATFGDALSSTRYVLQSAGRPVVAGVVWKLIGDGALDTSRPVAEYIPEFATNGKDKVTVEQVLTHTGGFPLAPLGFPAMLDREQRLAAFSRWRLTSEPGTTLEFHLTSAAWIADELCYRVSGRSMRDYLKAELAEPLGLTSIEIGPEIAAQTDVAKFVLVGDEEDQTVSPWGPWYLAAPEILAAGEPSHSMVSTAVDLALWYQALMTSSLWKRDAVEDALRVRVTLPVEGERGGTRSVPGNIALFVAVAGDDGIQRSFLPTSGSPRTFGHGGAPCQVAFADPETELSFAFLTNGYPASGYEQGRSGQNRITNIGNLAADLVL